MKERSRAIEDEITRLEVEIADYETALGNYVSAEETRRTHELLEARRADLEALMLEWEEVAQLIEANYVAQAYSCIGICCSISRQALILSLRQTQQSGSPAARTVVSALHTEHFSSFFRRSGETDFFACSNRPAGTTCSGFGWILRFIRTPIPLSL